jgi:two-component system LytT family response regulator
MTEQFSSIIIDDEINNIQLLKKILHRHCTQIRVIGEESDAENGVTLIEKLQPDLVFMDINMPKLSGFEVLKKLEPMTFEVIFITAFDEYALQAFEHHAIGYVTKPIDEIKLINVVEHAQQRILQKIRSENIFSLLASKMNQPEQSKIPLSTLNGLIFINEEDLMYCESLGNYTIFHTVHGKKITVSKRIGEFEKSLPSGSFVRIHDKYIINLKFVDEYVKGRGGEITIHKTTILPVSANRKDNLLSVFNKWMNR